MFAAALQEKTPSQFVYQTRQSLGKEVSLNSVLSDKYVITFDPSLEPKSVFDALKQSGMSDAKTFKVISGDRIEITRSHSQPRSPNLASMRTLDFSLPSQHFNRSQQRPHPLSIKHPSRATPILRQGIPFHLSRLAANNKANTIRNFQKMEDRLQLLNKSPELRLSLNLHNINRIIGKNNKFEFLCHPDCSVARNQAIKGSDIDCAMIVTDFDLTLEQKNAIIVDLQQQGFDVASLDETGNDDNVDFTTYERIKTEYNKTKCLSRNIETYLAGKNLV